MHRGATRKIRRASYLAVRVAVLFLIPASMITLFGAGSGRGWAVPGFLLPAMGVCISAVAASGVLEAFFALIGWLIGRDQSKAASTPPTPKKRSRIRRWLRAAFVVIVILLLGFSYVFGIGVAEAIKIGLAQGTADADRDDPYWRIDDLLAHRVPVPDAENSTPVVLKAAALLPEVMADDSTKSFEFLRTREWRLNNLLDDDCRLDADDATDLREGRTTLSKSLQIARTLAHYNNGRFDPKLGPLLIDTPLPWILNVRDVARLLAVDSAVRAHDKDFDGAFDSCRSMLNAARSFGDEPFLISQMTRLGISTRAAKAVRRVVGQGEASDLALAATQDRLLDELDEPLIRFGLRGERAVFVELCGRIASGQLTMEELSEDPKKFDPKRPREGVTPWHKLYFEIQQAVMLQWMNDACKIELEPTAARAGSWSKFQWRFQYPKNSIQFWLALLPIKVFPAASASAAAHARVRADLGVTAILIAAERHRKKTGKWPETMAAIDPSILHEPPVDPYTGEPFHIERRDGELIVYSVGANLRDEHGEFDKALSFKGGPDDITARGWDVSRRARAAPEQADTTDPEASPPPP